MSGSITHDLKIQPQFFEAILSGAKTFEVRRNDRGYRVGDYLRLREWEPDTETYTGRSVLMYVPYLTNLTGHIEVVMSIVPVLPSQ